MNYLWERFDIPKIRARTRVWLDGEYRADLSDESGAGPLHIMVQGGAKLPEKITARAGETVYLTAVLSGFSGKVQIDAEAGAVFRAGIFIENENAADISITANHLGSSSEISVDARIEAGAGSETDARASANIGPGLLGVKNSINFRVLAEPSAKLLRIQPNQFISSEKAAASHGAAIDKGGAQAILFLKEQGLDAGEANAALREAFRAGAFSHLPTT
ncbi:MAG: SufD family Fe-S cluster assembly protein [Rickettsiales bacterium]|jgi:hypothetical protein|nr:SufD family Fe-S cluster assembly protein [Rickettsiales bacterium]